MTSALTAPRRGTTTQLKAALFLIIALSCWQSSASAGATFVVTTTADSHDLIPGDGICQTADGDCSLRAALEEANARGGGDTIVFRPQAAWIRLQLGALEMRAPRTVVRGIADSTRIDGLANPFAAATLQVDSDSNLVIGVTFARARGHALVIRGSHNVIGRATPSDRNQFIINGQSTQEAFAIVIEGNSASRNAIAGNFIGLTGNGTVPAPNANGILIRDGAHGNIVGDDGVGKSNLISGNTGIGVMISSAAHHNRLINNIIGPNINGDDGPGNGHDGVVINSRAYANVVGGDSSSLGNLISLNGATGIELSGAGTDSNAVASNFVGVTLNGRRGIGNGDAGLLITSGACGNIIGLGDWLSGNLVSGNRRDGIRVVGAGTNGNVIRGNWVGIDSRGYGAIGNGSGGGNGIVISDGARYNVIGSVTSHNVLSANDGAGACLRGAGTSHNRVIGNIIGLIAGANGTQGNGCGVLIENQADDNVVGGRLPGERNIISGNDLYPFPLGAGVIIRNASRDSVLGNLIGTDSTGTRSGGNRSAGVVIGDGASDNVVGGSEPRSGNVISGNGDDEQAPRLGRGIHIFGEKTDLNRIEGNLIGLALDGYTPLPNKGHGVAIVGGAQENQLGGTDANRSNSIAFNNGHGLLMCDSLTRRNGVRHNGFWGNDSLGIAIRSSAQDRIEPPRLALSSDGAVEGSAVSLSHVDLYESDGDRSGRGEGQTYLATFEVGNDSTFRVSGLASRAYLLTAVVTDSLGNSSEFSTNLRVDAPTQTDDPTADVPLAFELEQNYPNPFNPSTTISYTLPTAAPVELRILNVLGQQVWSSTVALATAGTHTVSWGGTDSRGVQVASGVYWYCLQSRDHTAARKMLLLR